MTGLSFLRRHSLLCEFKRRWKQPLKEAFRQMPPFAWAADWDKARSRAVNQDDDQD